jgi:hypothetical protein
MQNHTESGDQIDFRLLKSERSDIHMSVILIDEKDERVLTVD